MTFPYYIEHIPSVNENFKNLSSDVFIFKGEKNNYVYDVGNGGDALKRLNEIENKIAIISHFHHDHIMNIDKCKWVEVYGGRLTKICILQGTVIEDELIINDGITLRAYYLRNSHAKDFLVLECGDYLFLSDSIYCTVIDGKRVYNATLLKEQIDALEKSNAKYFVVSHDDKLIYTKNEIIDKLKSIYKRRNPKLPYIPEEAEC